MIFAIMSYAQCVASTPLPLSVSVSHMGHYDPNVSYITAPFSQVFNDYTIFSLYNGNSKQYDDDDDDDVTSSGNHTPNT